MSRIRVSTLDLYNNYFASFQDVLWDSSQTSAEQFLASVRALAAGNMNGIREAFAAGEAVLMMGSQMEALEALEVKEIEVTHEDKTIGVLVDCEISY